MRNVLVSCALLAAILGAASLAACNTRSNPAVSCERGPCLDPGFPYCDSDGVIGGVPGACIAVRCDPGELGGCSESEALICAADGEGYERQDCPAGCDPRGGCVSHCTPNQPLSCENDQLTRCDASGTSTEVESCTMGCAEDGTRCLRLEPSNGLGGALAAAAAAPDTTLPAGTRINTELGIVEDSSGTRINVRTMAVNQASGAPIFVVMAGTLTVHDVHVTGTSPLAFVASGAITVKGRVSAKARTVAPGPGASTSAACKGGDQLQYDCVCSTDCSTGAGGAGGADVGGRGGAALPNGGAAVSGFSPLVGGCIGGSVRDASNTFVVAAGGGGGGAVQLVSATEIVLTEDGLIDVAGGGGGSMSGGGGAGGLVVLEAPSVSASGSRAGIAANGGAGAGCFLAGPDGQPTGLPAPGAVCPNYFAGRGGTGSTQPGNACVIQTDGCTATCEVRYGGGGGSVGRLRVATRHGRFETNGSPVVSARAVVSTLVAR